MSYAYLHSNKDKNTALKHIKVVEIGHFIAAPMVGAILAEYGAQVIHISNPYEPVSDPILDAILQRGKTCIALDLKSQAGKHQLIKLLSLADIVIENYRPNSLKALGIDFDEIREKYNPKLISSSIPAFPTWDKRNRAPGFESIAGMAGMIYEKAFKPPKYHRFPVGSIMAGLYSCNALAAALIAREKSQCGQHVEINLYESDLFAQMLQILALNGVPRSFLPLKMASTPFMGVWQCSDKRYIYLHIILPTHNKEILEILKKNGFENQIEELETALSEETKLDPSKVDSIEEVKVIKRILREIYASNTADYWERLLGERFCCIKIRNLEEWVMDNLSSGGVDASIIDDPLIGKLYTPGPLGFSSEFPTSIKPRKFTSNTNEILDSWGFDLEKFSDFEKKLYKSDRKKNNKEIRSKAGLPLEGIKVFDIARVIAGPFVARILAELGADVISLQNNKGLDWALSFHVVFNSGKKSVTMDLSVPEQRELFWKLLDQIQPDVFIQNFRSLDFTHEINLDYETIKSRVSDIVYTYVNAYGIEGDWQTRPAFEQVIQAVTGVQIEYVERGKPRLFPVAILDMGAGLLGGFNTLLGLYHRERTHHGGFYHAHMTSMAMWLQILGFARFQQKLLEKVPESTLAMIHYRPERKIDAMLVRSLNRFMVLSGHEEDLQAFFCALDILKDQNISYKNQMKRIKNILLTGSWQHWRRRARRLGFRNKIGIMPRHRIGGILHHMKRYHYRNHPIVEKKDYPGLGSMTFIHSPFHFSISEIIDLEPAPIRGENTQEIFSLVSHRVDKGFGIMEYPKDQPFLLWMWNFMVWGFYAIKSGNI